jgi:hypothetical protein
VRIRSADYVRQVFDFAMFLGRSPDQAEQEDLRRYQLHLSSLGASYARMNLACGSSSTSRSAGPASATAWPTSRHRSDCPSC